LFVASVRLFRRQHERIEPAQTVPKLRYSTLRGMREGQWIAKREGAAVKTEERAGRTRKQRYIYVLEFRTIEGVWMLSVDWPACSKLEVATHRMNKLNEKAVLPFRYRVRKCELKRWL
jgi:hypothetical protein